MTAKEFKQLERNADGDIVNLYNIHHLLNDKQIDSLTDDDWSRVNEYQLDLQAELYIMQ
tara:strand:+ start:134 stop:310 length:177 start_codon:yes stop_codon:yes gene_type:complete